MNTIPETEQVNCPFEDAASNLLFRAIEVLLKIQDRQYLVQVRMRCESIPFQMAPANESLRWLWLKKPWQLSS